MRTPRLTLTREKVVIPEKVREKNGLYVLELLGYKTWRIGKPVPVTCRNPKCRLFQWAAASGNSKGFPDNVIGHPAWHGFTLLLETKKTGGGRGEEQVSLVEQGYSTFVTTEEDFVRAVIAAEERMGLPVNPKLVNWLEVNRKGV